MHGAWTYEYVVCVWCMCVCGCWFFVVVLLVVLVYVYGACVYVVISCVLSYRDWETDRKSTRLNSSHITRSRMPSSA